MSDEHDLREVAHDSDDAVERIKESIVGDAAAVAGALFAGGSLGLGLRQQHVDPDAERAAIRAELAAEYEAERRAVDLEYRRAIVELYGLEGLDRFDALTVDDALDFPIQDNWFEVE